MKVLTLICFFASLQLSSGIYAGPPVKIGFEIDLPPYMSEELKGGGPRPLLIAEALESENIQVEQVWAPWARVLDSVKKGLIDCAGSAYYTKERAKIFDYSDAYSTVKTVVFTKRDFKLAPPILGSLSHVRTGIMRAYAYSSEILNADGVYYFKSTTLDEMINMFISGKITAFIAEENAALHIIKTKYPHLLAQLRVNTPALMSHTMHLVCLKRLKHSKNIIEKFNRALLKTRPIKSNQ